MGRIRVATVVASLVAAVSVVLPAVPAAADGPDALFSDSFGGATTAVPLALPAVQPYQGVTKNSACLTAQRSFTTTPPACQPSAAISGDRSYQDSAGAGALRLTGSTTYQAGGAFYAVSLPTSKGLDVTFTASQFRPAALDSDNPPADGMSVLLAATDPYRPAAPSTLGAPGGGLGYTGTQYSGLNGLPHGYLGVGLDVYGNYYQENSPNDQTKNATGAATACPRLPVVYGTSKNAVTVRGPGDGTYGYCRLSSTTGTTQAGGRLDAEGANAPRGAADVPVEVAINPSSSAVSTNSGVAVPARGYAVSFKYVGASASSAPKVLTGALPSMPSAFVGGPNWLDSNGIPKQLTFGFAGSTGLLFENHDIRNVSATTLFGKAPKLKLDVAAAPATVTGGDAVQYTITPSLDSSGGTEPLPVTIRYGIPNGLTNATPVSTSPNWSCTFGSCTYTPASGALPAGATLPPIYLRGNAGKSFTGAMTLNVTASSDDAASAVGSASIAVSKYLTPSTLTWATPDPITYGTALSSTQLNATGSPAGTVTYTPAAGTVLEPGTQHLTATFTPTSADYAPSTAAVDITVKKKTPTITWSAPDLTYPQPLGADQQVVIADAGPGSTTFDQPSGTVLDPGNQTLTGTFHPDDSTHYNDVPVSTSITVAKGTPTVTWPAPASITYGTALGDQQLNASADVAGSFEYTPAKGTKLSAGSHDLSVTFTPSDARYLPVTTTTSINVGIATPDVTYDDPAPITYGTPLGDAQLDATSPVDGTFTYTLADGSDARGAKLHAGSAQVITATFTPADGADYGTVVTTVHLDVRKAAPKLTWAAPDAITYGTALSAAQLAASSNGLDGSFAYSPAAGTVLGAGVAQLGATFTPSNTDDYESADVTTSITVRKATPSITWTPARITYGAPLGDAQLDATSNVPGGFTYSPASGTVLDAGTATLSASFTPTDTTNYESVPSTTAQLTIDPATPRLTWATPDAVTYNTPLSASQLNAAADQGLDGTFTYSPPVGTVLDAGTQTLGVTFTPTSPNYTVATAQQQLVVRRATPAVQWSAPDPIGYGTALGATQLNASSGVPGTFTYTLDDAAVSAGAVPAAGSHTLRATFTPTSANYVPTSATQPLTVTRAPQAIVFTDPGTHTYGEAPFALAATGGASGQPVTFATSSPACTVTAAGTVTLVSGGACVITASQSGSANYLPATDVQRSVTVNRRTPSITWAAPASIGYGTALGASQLNATVTPAEAATGGTLSYTADGAPVTAGAVLHAGPHTLGVTYTPGTAAAGKYTTATATTTLTVTKATQSLTFTQPADVIFGARPVALTGSSSAGLPVTFASTTPSVCTVNAATATVVAAGTCTITASQSGDGDRSAAASLTRSFAVAKASQAITVASLSDRTIGDAAFTVTATGGGSGAAVVLASSTPTTCSVSGAKVTLLAVGTCTLTANQAGNANYAPAPQVTTSFGIGYRVALYGQVEISTPVGGIAAFCIQVQDGAGKAVTKLTLRAATVDTATTPKPAAGTSNDFVWIGPYYKYALNSTGLSKGTHTLWFTISGDPTRHGLPFTVR